MSLSRLLEFWPSLPVRPGVTLWIVQSWCCRRKKASNPAVSQVSAHICSLRLRSGLCDNHSNSWTLLPFPQAISTEIWRFVCFVLHGWDLQGFPIFLLNLMVFMGKSSKPWSQCSTANCSFYGIFGAVASSLMNSLLGYDHIGLVLKGILMLFVPFSWSISTRSFAKLMYTHLQKTAHVSFLVWWLQHPVVLFCTWV